MAQPAIGVDDLGDDPIAASRRPTFRADLVAIVAFGAAIRLFYVVVTRHDASLSTDPAYYHEAANLLADGQGFISPYEAARGDAVAAADHPPLFTVYLAAFSFLGVRGVTGHALAASALGLACVVFGALVARELAGDRAGLAAAVLLAAYPGAWTYNGQLFAETAAMATVAGVLWATIRLTRRPSWRWATLAGALVGMAALSRSELALLGLFAVVPAVLSLGAVPWRRRLALAGAAGASAAIVVAPWVVHNLSRFDDPVLLSSQSGLTLAGSNCDAAYHGELMGYWSVRCARAALDGDDLFSIDQSEADRRMRAAAFTYMGDHVERLPFVMAARVARIAGLVPLDQVALDIDHEGRDPLVAWSAALSFYPLVGLAAVGFVALRRRRERRRDLVVVLAPVVVVVTVVALFFGLTRYRAPADVSLCVLAAVGLMPGSAAGKPEGSAPATPPA